MSDWYIVEPGGHVRKAASLIEGAAWFEKAAMTPFLEGGKRVKYDVLPSGRVVSTVFLALDHRHGEGPPLLFETMVFPSEGQWSELAADRYSTHEEALAGHARHVAAADSY